MKISTIIKWTLLTIMTLTPFVSFTQINTDSIYYNRLFYLCKAWGHAKYYHTEIANGSINWDNELLTAIDSVKNTTSNEAFNDAIQSMINNAGTMGTSTATLPQIPDSLNNNTDLDIAWIYDSVYLDITTSALLDTILQRFKPQNNVYVGSGSSQPTFLVDTLYHSGPEYPDENLRLLALFRYWNIIHYFYPYKYLMNQHFAFNDQHWDTSLVEFIPRIVEANDALSYHLAFKELTKRINDSHGFFISNTFNDWYGHNYTPFRIRFVENETVISNVLDGISTINVGDVIKKIDGHDIYDLRDSLRKYTAGSNEVIVDRNMNRFICWGEAGDFELTVENDTGEHTGIYQRNDTNYDLFNFGGGLKWTTKTNSTGCQVGVVNMGLLEQWDVNSMSNDLGETDAIIFDVRNYPNGTLTNIVNYMFPGPIHHVKFTVPYKNNPGRLYWISQYIGSGTGNYYQGKVIILFDENTQSHAEWTCMGLEIFPGAVKIGSTTSGADGNVASIYLPGEIVTYATFLGTYYPDYSQTQRLGIVPDIEMHPTILGIRNGEDEVMDFALNYYDCESTGLDETIHEQEITFYPNPVNQFLQYKLTENYLGKTVLFEIVDVQGRKLKAISKNSLYGEIDLSELHSGLYFVKIITNKNILIKAIIKN